MYIYINIFDCALPPQEKYLKIILTIAQVNSALSFVIEWCFIVWSYHNLSILRLMIKLAVIYLC